MSPKANFLKNNNNKKIVAMFLFNKVLEKIFLCQEAKQMTS